MKNPVYIKKIVIVLLLIIAFIPDINAQNLEDVFGFNDDNVNDVPEAPIHFLVALGLLIGGFIGVKKFKKE
ncbi:hypothetical protein [Psychroflexus salis]|uniref:Uncharacterized protein n=1 Tax=Psychroflexus salis TaxID=1526574 RepID=A0A917ECF4_9FLAO|nr:hypothetical protein [Psychroflexus salis]GGE22119.1 hypothetical protein GCM10010831_23980 [Psychroflexus salis]